LNPPPHKNALAEANKLAEGNEVLPFQKISFTEHIPSEPWPCLFSGGASVFEGGPWNEKLTRFEDWEYAVRLLATGLKIAHLPGTYAINREHQRRGVYDHPHKPDAVERGLKSLPRSGVGLVFKPEGNFKIAQLIAVRYWEMDWNPCCSARHNKPAEAFAGAKTYNTKSKVPGSRPGSRHFHLRLAARVSPELSCGATNTHLQWEDTHRRDDTKPARSNGFHP